VEIILQSTNNPPSTIRVVRTVCVHVCAYMCVCDGMYVRIYKYIADAYMDIWLISVWWIARDTTKTLHPARKQDTKNTKPCRELVLITTAAILFDDKNVC